MVKLVILIVSSKIFVVGLIFFGVVNFILSFLIRDWVLWFKFFKLMVLVKINRGSLGEG